MKKKAINTNEQIEELTKEELETLEAWQVSTLDNSQLKRITQRRYEQGIELSREDKQFIGLELTGKEVGQEVVSSIIGIALAFGGLVLLWYIFY